jgi:hypothetical protein
LRTVYRILSERKTENTVKKTLKKRKENKEQAGISLLLLLFEQRVSEFKMTINFPYNNNRKTDHQVSCTQRSCQTADYTNDHHSNAHGINASLS